MKKINVLFVSLSNLEGNFEPLGIECLAGHLNKIFTHKISVSAIAVKNVQELEILLQQVTFSNFDVLGLSLSFNTLDFLYEIMQKISETKKQPHVILGNVLATFNVELLLSRYPKVGICLGSGELTVQEFIEYLLGTKKIADISGFAYRDSFGKIQLNTSKACPIALPQRSFLQEIFENPTGRIYIEASRGCPYSCSFCLQNKFFNYCRTKKSRTALKNELIILSKITHGKISLLDFVDEDLLADAENTIAIAEIVHELKYEGVLSEDVSIMCSISVQSVLKNYSALAYLVSAGLRHCFIGIESFSNPQLTRLGKNHTAEKASSAIRLSKKLGLECEVGFIMFEPETTLLDIELNCAGIKNTGIEAFISNPFHQWRALKNTTMTKRLSKKGLVSNDYDANWLTSDWHYADKKVANIVREAKTLENGLSLVETAIKEVFRSELFDKLPKRSQYFIISCKKDLNLLFINFLEDATTAMDKNNSIYPIKKHYAQKALLFLREITTQKREGCENIIAAAKTAYLFKKNSIRYAHLLPQDEAKN